MGGEVAIGDAQLREPILQQPEMPGFLAANLNPVGGEGGGIKPGGGNRTREPGGHVESEIDGVKFYMGDGVKKYGAALRRPQSPFRRSARRDQSRP